MILIVVVVDNQLTHSHTPSSRVKRERERLPFIALDPSLPPFVRQLDSTFEMPSLALQGLLADLTRDFHGEQHGQSVDVLQYCADWFQAKLRSEASHLPMTI
jgi:hypothetical protein